MQKNENILTYELRELLREKGIKNLVLEIFNEYKKEKEKTSLYIHAFDFCINSINERMADSYGDYKTDYNKCYEIPELIFITYLIDNKIINASIGGGDDNSDMILSIKNINKEKFQIILNWVKNTQYIINFGLFSLNTLTCATFFKNKHIEKKFRPDSGIYNVFKKLITDKEHFISFEEIAKYIDNKNSEKEFTYKDQSRQLIKGLREKLLLTGGLGKKLLPMYSGGYKLISSILPE